MQNYTTGFRTGKKIFEFTYQESSEKPRYMSSNHSPKQKSDPLKVRVQGIKPMPQLKMAVSEGKPQYLITPSSFYYPIEKNKVSAKVIQPAELNKNASRSPNKSVEKSRIKTVPIQPSQDQLESKPYTSESKARAKLHSRKSDKSVSFKQFQAGINENMKDQYQVQQDINWPDINIDEKRPSTTGVFYRPLSQQSGQKREIKSHTANDYYFSNGFINDQNIPQYRSESVEIKDTAGMVKHERTGTSTTMNKYSQQTRPTSQDSLSFLSKFKKRTNDHIQSMHNLSGTSKKLKTQQFQVNVTGKDNLDNSRSYGNHTLPNLLDSTKQGNIYRELACKESDNIVKPVEFQIDGSKYSTKNKNEYMSQFKNSIIKDQIHLHMQQKIMQDPTFQYNCQKKIAQSRFTKARSKKQGKNDHLQEFFNGMDKLEEFAKNIKFSKKSNLELNQGSSFYNQGNKRF